MFQNPMFFVIIAEEGWNSLGILNNIPLGRQGKLWKVAAKAIV